MLFKLRSLLSASSAVAGLIGLALCLNPVSAQSLRSAKVFLQVEEPLSIAEVTYSEQFEAITVRESQTRFFRVYKAPFTRGEFTGFELPSDPQIPSPRGRRLEVGFDKFGNHDGVMLLGLKGSGPIRRRLAGLQAGHYSDGGKHLMLRTSRMIELHKVEGITADSDPVVRVETTGDFHFADDSRFFFLIHDGLVQLYETAEESGQPLWEQRTMGFAIGAERLKTGELIVATRSRFMTFREDSEGSYKLIGIHVIDDPTWQIRNFSVAPTSAGNSTGADRRVALGMRRVTKRPTMSVTGGAAELRVRVFDIPATPGTTQGQLVDVLDIDKLVTSRWSYGSPGFTWPPDASYLIAHSRDTAWSVELP